MMTAFIIVMLICVLYGLCLGGVIVEFKYVTGYFPNVDDYDCLLVFVMLFAPICVVAGGVVCVYKVIKESKKE